MEQLFLQILNNAITVNILILAVIIVRALGKRMPKWISCLLWMLVAVKLIIPVDIESVFSLIPTGEPIPVSITMDKNPQIYSGIEGVDKIINPTLQQHFSPTETASINPLQTYVYIGMILWVLGIMGLFCYAIVTYILVKRRVRASVRVDKKIYECDDIADPFILGIIRPAIYMPSGLSEEMKSCVLKHELAHLSRKDYIWKPSGFLILSVYWFNPLCWIAYILLCRDIEYACDEKATKGESEIERAAYCEALLACSMPRKMLAACPIAFGENGVKGRVKNVMKNKKPTFWITTASIVICIIVAVCFATNKKENQVQQNNCPFEAVSNDKIFAMSLAYTPNLLQISEEDVARINEALTNATWNMQDQEADIPDGECYSIFLYNNGNPIRMNFYGNYFVTFEQNGNTSIYVIDPETAQIVYSIANPEDINSVSERLIECDFEKLTNEGVWLYNDSQKDTEKNTEIDPDETTGIHACRDVPFVTIFNMIMKQTEKKEC